MVGLDRPVGRTAAVPLGLAANNATAPTASRPATPTARPSSPAALDTTGLTPEETGYLQKGWLPANFADLKATMQTYGRDAAIAQARKGKQGPFSARYGDPVAMLEYARNLAARPEFARLYGDVRKGDILLFALDGNGSQDIVQKFSKGPFGHALICTSDGPPPEFIEAIGLTGAPNDPSGNRVRRAPAADYTWDRFSVRLLRPTAGMAEPARSEAVDRAVAYAQAQLGKPYDYTFLGEPDGKSFYCSDLVYLAYTKGAGIQFPLSKSGDRDEAVAALKGIIETLEPANKDALMTQAATFAPNGQLPSHSDILNFVVDKVLPQCAATSRLVATASQRARFKSTLNKVLQGQAFPRFDAACQAYQRREQAIGFKTPVLGGLERLWLRTEISLAMVRDLGHLCDDSGASKRDAISTVWTIAKGILPYADTLAEYGFGSNDPRTVTVRGLMDRMDWAAATAHRVPLIGRFYPLPGRAKPAPVNELISPSDLAWSPFWHLDYNVKASLPLDPSKAGKAG